jgi:hypothetical protein
MYAWYVRPMVCQNSNGYEVARNGVTICRRFFFDVYARIIWLDDGRLFFLIISARYQARSFINVILCYLKFYLISYISSSAF